MNSRWRRCELRLRRPPILPLIQSRATVNWSESLIAPSGPLHLRAAQSFARLETTGSGNGSVLELWNAGGDQTTIGAINFRNTAGYPGQIAYLGGGAQAMTFRVSDVERARIDAAGRFGLGTISPAAQLHVKSFLAAGTSLAQFTSVVNAPPFNSETLHFTFNDISADGILSGAPVDLPISLNDLSTGNVVLAGGGGKVGVRTGSPTHFLTVESPDSETMRLIGPGATYGYFGRLNFGDADYVYLYEDQDDRLEIHSSRTAFTGGSIGINTFAPARRLDVYDTGIWSARFGTNNSNAAACEFANFQSGTIWEFAVCGTQSFFGLPAGSMYLFRQSSPSPDLTILPDGTTRVKVLEITGADLAEKFPTSEAREAVEPGTVMEIDPENAGKLRIARGAYNRRVAGVVSGAGDLSVGAVLGNLPGCEDAPPIALSGRVWVRCDASEQGIEPGDLLTTSDTPGYAMKVIDCPRAQGAIIGKAMSTLGHGETGLVLVLVGLQ